MTHMAHARTQPHKFKEKRRGIARCCAGRPPARLPAQPVRVRTGVVRAGRCEGWGGGEATIRSS